MRVLGALLLPVAVLLPAAYVGHRLSEDRPAPVRPTGVVWAGRVFVDSASLSRWLHARGGSYAVWAARHPGLAWPTKPVKGNAKAEATRPGSGHLMLGGLLALAAGVVLALSVANPPRGLVRLASRRGPPQVVWRGSLARSQALAVTVRETPLTRLLTAARAAPTNTAYALHRLRREHPQVGWYVAGGLIAAAVGVLVPYSLH